MRHSVDLVLKAPKASCQRQPVARCIRPQLLVQRPAHCVMTTGMLDGNLVSGFGHQVLLRHAEVGDHAVRDRATVLREGCSFSAVSVCLAGSVLTIKRDSITASLNW